MGRRNNGLSEQWAVGIMGCRNNGSSELWAVGIMTRNRSTRGDNTVNLVTSRKTNARLARPIVPKTIHNPIAIKLLVTGLMTLHNVMYACFYFTGLTCISF